MNEDQPFTEFDYLLNRFERASQADKPAEHDYGIHRKALYAYVRALERASTSRQPEALTLPGRLPEGSAGETVFDEGYVDGWNACLDTIESRLASTEAPAETRSEGPGLQAAGTAELNEVHSCSYFCDRPACIKAQRDELRAALPQGPAVGSQERPLRGIAVANETSDFHRAALKYAETYAYAAARGTENYRNYERVSEQFEVMVAAAKVFIKISEPHG